MSTNARVREQDRLQQTGIFDFARIIRIGKLKSFLPEARRRGCAEVRSVV